MTKVQLLALGQFRAGAFFFGTMPIGGTMFSRRQFVTLVGSR
jgi:hypothetical protein